MNQTLYDKYGGFPTISAIVSAFYEQIGEQESLERFFRGSDMAKLLDHQTKFLCKVLGGPDNYEGRSLKPAHLNLGIDQKSYMLVGSILQQTLENAGVEAADVATIMAIVISVKDEIITVRAAA